jgi:hypothetical protein
MNIYSRVLAYRTEVVKNDLNPNWRMFRVNMQLLCGGDRNRLVIHNCRAFIKHLL